MNWPGVIVFFALIIFSLVFPEFRKNPNNEYFWLLVVVPFAWWFAVGRKLPWNKDDPNH